MIGADTTNFSVADAVQAALSVREAQVAQLREAISQVTATMRCEPNCLVMSGAGGFLGEYLASEDACGVSTVSLCNRLGADVSASATAHALAVLAGDTHRGP
jgi:uncharacterized hydantoinase/oxoprolinase family protein